MSVLTAMIGTSMAFALSMMPQLQPPTTRVVDCTGSGCHAKQVSYQFLHGPAAVTACNSCHEYSDAERHRFNFKRDGAELCNFCHVGKTDLAGMNVHQPVSEEKCITCHDPHGSNRRFMLSGETNAAMCLACHEPLLEGREQIHTPISNGECLNCHRAHASLHDKLLIEPKEQLCKQCHASVFAPILAAQLVALQIVADPESSRPPSPFIHQPVGEDCTICHETHASNHAALLKDEPIELCGSCHEPTMQVVEHARTKHSVVTADRACLNCHSPHDSVAAHLLLNEPLQVCLDCHDTTILKSDETYVTSLADLVDPDAQLHDPVAKGQCRSCHNPHGSPNAYLLNEPFPREFYLAYSRQAYALCFNCHESGLATEPETDTTTNFRNGMRNLHYLHVTAQGESGRNCRVCHSAHASRRKQLIRSSVPFGEWKVPIMFEATDTGGSCAAGCHRAYRYDRNHPVINIPASFRP